MKDKKKMSCHWCDQTAVRIDYRTIDGITSKIVSCDDCFKLSTNHLLKRKYE